MVEKMLQVETYWVYRSKTRRSQSHHKNYLKIDYITFTFNVLLCIYIFTLLLIS